MVDRIQGQPRMKIRLFGNVISDAQFDNQTELLVVVPLVVFCVSGLFEIKYCGVIVAAVLVLLQGFRCSKLTRACLGFG